MSGGPAFKFYSLLSYHIILFLYTAFLSSVSDRKSVAALDEIAGELFQKEPVHGGRGAGEGSQSQSSADVHLIQRLPAPPFLDEQGGSHQGGSSRSQCKGVVGKENSAPLGCGAAATGGG